MPTYNSSTDLFKIYPSLSQMLCIFSALHHNSVNVVIVWTTAGGAAIEAGVGLLLGGAPLEREQRMALMVGFGAGILELMFDSDKVMDPLTICQSSVISRANITCS